MAERLKRWESPRRRGRNDKGRGGSARKRQRQKQIKNLVKKLKQQSDPRDSIQYKFQHEKGRRIIHLFPFLVAYYFFNTHSLRRTQIKQK